MKTFDNLTAEEEIIYKWQYSLFGDFFTSLMKTIMLADGNNLNNLEKAFPDHVSGYRRYTTESGWWDMVQEKMGTKGM